MSPVRVTWLRTVSQLVKTRSTALLTAVFLSAGSAMLLYGLEAAEGSMLSFPAVWALSMSPLLPVMSAFMSMDIWSGEFRTGRIAVLLSTPVRERDLVIGKFLGVWMVLFCEIALSCILSIVLIWFFAPSAFSGLAPIGFVPAFAILALQGALWCSVSGAFSAFFRSSATALCSLVTVLVVLPRGIWAALTAWSYEGRSSLGEMPLDAHALDFASGAFSSGWILVYFIATITFIFITSKAVAFRRLVGRGAYGFRFSSVTAIVLSVVFSLSATMLAMRLDMKFNLPTGQSGSSFSERTRGILSECDGEITITVYLPRSDVRFRSVGQFLRSLRREAESLGGVRIVLRFVDPRWDLAAAERLVRRGVSEHSVVFERGRRMTIVPIDEGFGERICSSALHRVATPPMRRNVYWTVGHGESSRSDYGPFGMSDIARDLAREGYLNRDIDFAAGVGVPEDCALLVVAGAKDDFSRFEIGLVESYLRRGGRLLVLLSAAERGGVTPLLPAWGMRSTAVALPNARTLSGSDVVVSDFADHDLSRSLTGSRMVLGKPVGFVPSAVADAGAGKIEFVPVATVEGTAIAASVERGAEAGNDIAIRPTRIVAVGDSTFVMNGMLAARANANRDFFLNCVAYLSGSEPFGSGGNEAGMLVAGMDRGMKVRFLLIGSLAVPLAVCMLMLAAWAGGRPRR